MRIKSVHSDSIQSRTYSSCAWSAVLLVCVAYSAAQTASAVMETTEESAAFYAESMKLLSAKMTTLALGRHGELISAPSIRSRTPVFVIKRSDGAYSLAVFDFPKRYYFGRISEQGDIVYDFDNLPPDVNREAFCGPVRWPVVDTEGHPDFRRSERAAIYTKPESRCPTESGQTDYVAVAYACLDNDFFISAAKEVQSPFALIIVRGAGGNLDVCDPNNRETRFLTISNGGWTDSWLIFKRDGSGVALSAERKIEWPYHDATGGPKLPEYLFLNPEMTCVASKWTVYDLQGKPIGIKKAPIP